MSQDALPKTVTINVGGTVFQTTKQTLEGSTYFQSALLRWLNAPEQPIFVDRCPMAFRHVLNRMRDPQYPFPNKYAFELEFYGVAPLTKEEFESQTDLGHIWNAVTGIDAAVRSGLAVSHKAQGHLKKIKDASRVDWPDCHNCCKKILPGQVYCSKHQPRDRFGCWDENVRLCVEGKGWVESKTLREGDRVGTPKGFRRVKEVRFESYLSKRMVFLPSFDPRVSLTRSFAVTHGHPVLQQDGGWLRAREMAYPVIACKDVRVVNLVLEGDEHAVVVQEGWTIGTMGLFDPSWHSIKESLGKNLIEDKNPGRTRQSCGEEGLRDGCLPFGEMEHGSLISSGVSRLLKERTEP